jgi:hypothetical protein
VLAALNGSALFIPEQDSKSVPSSCLWVPLEKYEVVASLSRLLWVATFQVGGVFKASVLAEIKQDSHSKKKIFEL